MAQQEEQTLIPYEAASSLRCLSKGCTSRLGSKCESDKDSGWPCVFSVLSPSQTQTLLDPTPHGIPDESTSQQSGIPATSTADTSDQSGLVAPNEDSTEGPPDQCGEGFDRGLQNPSPPGLGNKDIGKKKATVVLADESDQGPISNLGPSLQSSNLPFSYTTEFAQGVEPVKNWQEIPGECADSLARCRHSGKEMEPQYFAAAEYLYELVYEEKKKLNWDFFGRNLTKFRTCDFILMNGNKNKGLRPITSFMTWVRFEIMEIHQGCSTLEWALEDAGDPRIKGSTAEPNLRTAYEKIRYLCKDRTKSTG